MRVTREHKRVRVGDVVTWGRGASAYRVESIDNAFVILDVTADAGSRHFRDVNCEAGGRHLLRIDLAQLKVTYRPGAPRRVNARRAS